MSGRIVSADIQTRAEGDRLYVWYNMDATAVYTLWKAKISTVVFYEIIQKDVVVTAEIEENVYANQENLYCIRGYS
jgi:hypothetical protein